MTTWISTTHANTRSTMDLVSMDFIVNFPVSRGYNSSMVIINYFSKQAHIVPTKLPLISVQVAKMFFKHIFKYHGMLVAIVSDRDLCFPRGFWPELQMSSTTHPQSDGQIERVNQSLEAYIRCYV